MLYSLKTDKKICLPHILFQYLKDAIFHSRTSDGKKEVSTNIPFGRLISDILMESRLVDALKEAGCTEDLNASVGATLNAKNLQRMEVIKKICVSPNPEPAQETLMQQFLCDGFPMFYEIENPQVIAHYIYLMELDGINTSGLNFAEIPLVPTGDKHVGSRLRRRKQVTEDIERETKRLKREAWKDRKREWVEKDVALKAYTEPSQKGNSDSASQFIETSFKPLLSTSSENSISLSFSTPPATQISDTPISESNFFNNSGSEPNNSEIPTSEPLNSEITTSEEIKYADPYDFENIENLVKSLAQQQRTKTTSPSMVSGSGSMPISSTPLTRSIPVAYLDISDDEVLISDAIPTVTSPSDPPPQTELVPFQFIPNNIEEYINLFGYDALRKIHELRTSDCPHPVLVRRAWYEFRRWLDTSLQNIAQMAESTEQTEVLAAAERRIQYEFEKATRLANRKKAAEEKAALEDAEKVEFLRDQAEIEQVLLEREELERAEAEKAEALMLAEKARLAEELAEKAKADAKKAEAERIRAESVNIASEGRTCDATRLDAVEQRMDKFSEKQDDMKKQIDSFGDALKKILERLPEKRSEALRNFFS